MKDFNFFSPYLGKSKSSKNKQLLIALTVIGLVGFIGGSFGWNRHKTNEFQREITEMESYLKDSKVVENNKKVEDYKKQIETGKKQLTALDTMVAEMDKKNVVSSELIDKITAVIPEKVGFKTVSIGAEVIQIQGKTKDLISIAEFQHNLKGIEGIKEVLVPNISKVVGSQPGKTGEEEYLYSLECRMKTGDKNENK